jgi:hypothetical protein
MKKCKLICFVVLVLSAYLCNAQDKQILYIDSICNDINKQIEEGVVMPHTINYVVNRPAIGIQNTTLEFYYNALSSENWDYDKAADSVTYAIHKELYKVVMSYNVAASEFIRKTYYYDKDKLIFFEAILDAPDYVSKMDSLRVYYFDAGSRKFDKYTYGITADILPDDRSTAEDAVTFATEYQAFFRQMNALEEKQH